MIKNLHITGITSGLPVIILTRHTGKKIFKETIITLKDKSDIYRRINKLEKEKQWIDTIILT